MSVGVAYKVDLDALLSHVEDCEAFDTKVQDWLDQIDAALARLELVWSGDGAEAHRAHHDRWAKGLAQLREGLAKLKEQARTNHDSYTGLVAHQRGMWP